MHGRPSKPGDNCQTQWCDRCQDAVYGEMCSLWVSYYPQVKAPIYSKYFKIMVPCP